MSDNSRAALGQVNRHYFTETAPTGYSAVGDNQQEDMTKANQGETVIENNKTTNGEKNVNRAVRDNPSANKAGI